MALLTSLNVAVRDAKKAANTFKSNANMTLKRQQAQVADSESLVSEL